MLRVEIRHEQRALRNMRKQAEREAKAFRRAVGRTKDWAAGQAARAIARAHYLPLRALTRGSIGRAGRVRAKANMELGTFTIWIGTRPMKAGYIGALRQTSTGAEAKLVAGAGRRKFPGAFVATVPGGHQGIFKRGSILKRHTRDRQTHWQANLPIKEQYIPLDRAQRVIEPIREGIPAQFEKVWRQQSRFRRGR